VTVPRNAQSLLSAIAATVKALGAIGMGKVRSSQELHSSVYFIQESM
jgi:hypothetical protein